MVVAGPFKSQAEMAKTLGVSQQYVNRKIRQYRGVFQLDGKKVFASREVHFASGKIAVKHRDDLAVHLGVSSDAVAKVLRKKSSGFVQTSRGKMKVQRLKPGEKPTLPAVRVLWDDDTEKQDFFSFAAAAKELKIDSKTIPTALKAGRDCFQRKSDGKKFTFEIPRENIPSRLKPKPFSEAKKAEIAEAKRQYKIRELYELKCFYMVPGTTYEDMESVLERIAPEELEEIRGKSTPPEKEESPPKEVPLSPRKIPVPTPRKIPVPTPRKIPVPTPRKIPVPTPRKKVLQPPPRLSGQMPARSYFEDDWTRLDAKQVALESKYVWVTGDMKEAEEYQNMLKAVDKLELQKKQYFAMREKYLGWFLDNDVDQFDETVMVLFNLETGEYARVANYDDIANYFQSREYDDFLSREAFNATLNRGRIEFDASKNSKLENWRRYILIKDPMP